jgi:transposase
MSTSPSTTPAIEIGNLPEDVGVLKNYVQQLWHELARAQADLQALREHFDVFLKRYFGPKGEKLHSAQRLLFDIAIDPALAQLLSAAAPEEKASDTDKPDETVSGRSPDVKQDDDHDDESQRKKGAHGRRRIPPHIRRNVIVVDLSLVEKSILESEGELRELPPQISHYYEWIPPALVVNELQRKRYVLADSLNAEAAPEGAEEAEQLSPPNAVSAASSPEASAKKQMQSRRRRRISQAALRAAERARRELTGLTGVVFAELCLSPIIMPPLPPRATPGGLAGPMLLAQTIVSKYADHLPLHRLERIFERSGVGFSRSTTCDWCQACADLLRPLAEMIREEVLRSFVIHTDDTPVKICKNHEKIPRYQGRFWTYWGDDDHPLVWFDFTPNRKRAGPDSVLRNFRGYLQADGYGGYDDYEGVELSPETPILKVACWVHARRKFRDALGSAKHDAGIALAYIASLYQIEKEIRRRIRKEWSAVPKSELHKRVAQARKEKAKPILDEFKKWLAALRQKPLLPKSQLAKAVTYVENQWDALVRYVDDGRLKPDNNTAERAIRGIAIGRRNWLFCGSEKGGHTAAVFFSVVSSAIRNGLEPLQYLCMLLTEIPKLGDSPTPDQLAPLMPHVWKPLVPTTTTTTVTPTTDSAEASTTTTPA